jgi:hypothetical protein
MNIFKFQNESWWQVFDNGALKLTVLTANQITALYKKYIQTFAGYYYLAGGSIKKTGSYSLDDLPLFNHVFQKMLKEFHGELLAGTEDKIKQAYELSNTKNNAFVRQVKGLAVNVNDKAVNSFINRTEAGLNLSDRVWNLIDGYKVELEAALVAAINEGLSARQLASLLQKYLKEPERIFRRADSDGAMKLSPAAKRYNPGRGVYRSSFQNALRMTGTEINMAYRTADFERWSISPLVKGIKVQTSNNHPKFDICDAMAGTYPKDFLFRGWHPRCRCFATPVMISTDQLNAQERYNLGLDKKPSKIDLIKAIPAGAKKWVAANAQRIRSWANKPYFISDNPKYLKV